MLVRNVIDIGLVIRERRRKLKLDQEELARRAGVSRQWIIDIEKGKPRAEIGLVLRTFGALGLVLSVDADARPEGAGEPGVPSVDIDDIINDLQADRP